MRNDVKLAPADTTRPASEEPRRDVFANEAVDAVGRESHADWHREAATRRPATKARMTAIS
jgi:hypothetical protein